jgi:ATP-binding cassette subfamily C (CFTR/MRP) protein 1
MFTNPLILYRIVEYLNSDEPLLHGLLYVLALFFANLLMSLSLRRYFYSCYRVGLRLRTAVITSVFSKALVLSTSELMKRSVGEISNLMSVDSTRLQDLTPYLHAIWYSFFQIAVALSLLWYQVGFINTLHTATIVINHPFGPIVIDGSGVYRRSDRHYSYNSYDRTHFIFS